VQESAGGRDRVCKEKGAKRHSDLREGRMFVCMCMYVLGVGVCLSCECVC